MKESRLFKIVYFILENGRVTAPQLAEKFEVSVRTIYRDVDVISSAGIPIYVTTGRNGGIQLLDHYVLEKVFFSDYEKHDILSALQSLSVINNGCDKEILTKLSALFNVESEKWFEVDFDRWGGKSQDNVKFELLKNATIYHRAVSIVYVGTVCSKMTRKIYPLKLLYKSKEWYIKAYCTEREDFRLFKMNRIVSCEMLEETFIPMVYPEIQLSGQSISCEKIVLRFPKELAYRIYDEFQDDEISIQKNGDLRVVTYMPNDNWLTGYLLSFGDSVEVIEPKCLHETLYNVAEKIREKNKP